MKTDELGEYDENAIPDDLKLPLKLDRENDAIAGDDNAVLARFNFSSETVLAGFARRRADFIVRLANGELLWSHGHIVRKVAEQWQDGQLVATFVPIGILTKEEFYSLSKEIVESSIVVGKPGPIVPLSKIATDGLVIELDVMTKTDKRKFETLRKRFVKFVGKLNDKYMEDKK